MRKNLLIIIIPVLALALVGLGWLVEQELAKSSAAKTAEGYAEAFNTFDFSSMSLADYTNKIAGLSTTSFMQGPFSSDESRKALGYEADNKISSSATLKKARVRSFSSSKASVDVTSAITSMKGSDQQSDVVTQRVEMVKIGKIWKMANITSLF